jgi:secondary thiamine-phosphate synthase enzyme
MITTRYLELSTQGNTDIIDITPGVEQLIAESGIQSGLVCLFTPSATSAFTTIEYESGALSDLRRALEDLAPHDGNYDHNLRWGDGNGHSHLRAALMKPSLSVPIVDNQPTLGTWQQIVFLDFDVRPRNRRLVVQILGNSD